MNRYLARLRALNSEKSTRWVTDKTDMTAAFVSFDADPSRCLVKNQSPAREQNLKNAKFAALTKPANPPFAEALATLERRCPEYVPVDRWRQCIGDARWFLAQWGSQALALGWTGADLFGLHEPAEKPHPSYQRLSRHDATGLLWCLRGREVKGLTATEAVIATPGGGTLTWCKPVGLV